MSYYILSLRYSWCVRSLYLVLLAYNFIKTNTFPLFTRHRVAGRPFNIPLMYSLVLWNNFQKKKKKNWTLLSTSTFEKRSKLHYRSSFKQLYFCLKTHYRSSFKQLYFCLKTLNPLIKCCLQVNFIELCFVWRFVKFEVKNLYDSRAKDYLICSNFI